MLVGRHVFAKSIGQHDLYSLQLEKRFQEPVLLFTVPETCSSGPVPDPALRGSELNGFAGKDGEGFEFWSLLFVCYLRFVIWNF
jgi:hypothetical protein